jgi:hypothetical protein
MTWSAQRDILYIWRKETISADVFVWAFTSASNRDLSAKLCNKIVRLSPSSAPPPLYHHPALPAHAEIINAKFSARWW